MNPIKAIIVDDEPLAREGIRMVLQADPELMLLPDCGDGAQAVAAIRDQSPHLVFLDVQMPEKNGFEVLLALEGAIPPVVVFVTAYDQYALKAFDMFALDYLLKPFTDARLKLAVSRAKEQVHRIRAEAFNHKIKGLLQDYRRQGDDLRTEAPRPDYLTRLVVKAGGKVRFLDVGDIQWIEAADYYIHVHTTNKNYLLREKMGHMETVLDPSLFLRIHRSTIVNIQYVVELEPNFRGEYEAVLRDGTKLKMSKSRRHAIGRHFGQSF